jgi:hypothetical protein
MLQQMSSPEWRTQQAVIAAKRRQLAVYQSRVLAPMSEHNRRLCQHGIQQLQRVIAADEKATQELEDLGTK